MKTNQVFDIAVVGNGPSAYHFLDELDSKITKNNINLNVAHINSASNEAKINSLPKVSFMNNQSNKTWKYFDLTSKFNKLTNFQSSSNTPGGLMANWGAGCSELNDYDMDVKINLKSYFQLLLKKINIISGDNNSLDKFLGIKKNFYQFSFPTIFRSYHKSLTFGFAKKAIAFKDDKDIKKCNFCGYCNTHCFNNSIYNAAKHNNFLKNKNINVFDSHELVSFKCSDNKYHLELKDINKKKVYSITTNNLVLACGTINSSKLILDYLNSSNIKVNTIPIKHNPIIRSVFLSFKKFPDNQPSGQNISYFKNKSYDFYSTYMFGYHISSSDFLSFIPFKNRFVRYLIDFLKKYIIISLTFFPSNFSSSSIIYDKNHINIISKKNHSALSFLFRMLPFFKSMFLNFCFPVYTEKLKSGSDLHYGGTFPIGPKKDFNTSHTCQLNNHSGLYLIDGSWMPRISPKPHTYTLMANARRIANVILDQLKKNDVRS